MNGFLEKTKQNLSSAQILLTQSHYASSVHCAFYACLQMLLHVLFVKLKHDRKQFINAMQRNKTGTHEQISKLIADEIQKRDKDEVKWFKRNFSHLKTLRVKADYEAIPILQSEGHTALNTMNAINNLVKKLF